MELYLKNDDVDKLIALKKILLSKHNIDLSSPSKGHLPIHSTVNQDQYCVDYFIRPGKSSLNFRELTYNYSILRLNLNDGFHRNSDNTKVTGNRINVYSFEEFHDKGDSKTYMKAYSLPHLEFHNTSDPEIQLIQLLKYTNTNYKDKLFISGKLV